jgi:hypothetical protein
MSDYSIFPKAIDGYAQLPLSVDRVTPVSAEGMNRLRSAIINIENALGALPQAEFEDVAERLDAIDGDITSLEALVATLNGDVIGPSSATNNSLVQFDGVTGKLIKEFGIGADGLALVADSTAPSGLSWSSTSENLANTLLLGNETLGSNVIFSTGDDLVGETGLTIRTDADLADLTLKTADGVDSGSVIIQTGTGSSTRGTVEVKSPEVLFDNGTQSAALLVGTGDPNGSITAITGSIFVDSTGPGLYQNDSGGTAWTDVFGWPTAVGTDYAGTPYEQALVTATNGYIVITPNGTGSIQAQVADGTSAGGNSRGDYAVDLQLVRSTVFGGNNQVASGDYSTLGGGRNNKASGSYSTVSGGYFSSAYGDRSTVSGGENNSAGGLQSTVGGGANGVASGSRSTVSGGRNNTASASYSTVSGGSSNTASGIRATVSGGLGNTASSYYSTVSGGRSNQASGLYSVVGGGRTNQAQFFYSTISGGYLNTLSGINSVIGGGRSNTSSSGSAIGGGNSNTASGSYSTVSGGIFSLADHYGEFAHGSGRFSADGDAQYSRMVLRRETTNATPLELSASGFGPTGTARLSLIDNSGYQFHIQVIARDTSGTDSAWWDIRGCIVRSSGAATTTLIGTNIVATSATAGAAAWTLTATADTVNGALKVEATGAAATIRWVATIHSTKVAY